MTNNQGVKAKVPPWYALKRGVAEIVNAKIMILFQLGNFFQQNWFGISNKSWLSNCLTSKAARLPKRQGIPSLPH